MNIRPIQHAVAVLFAVSGMSYAGQVGPLTTFVANTPAKASEVNGNFSAVSAAVNDNDTRITALQTTVSSGTFTPPGSVTLTGNITLPQTTQTTGILFKGTAPFIHNFGTRDIFIGVNAGNLAPTNTGTDNTAIGQSAMNGITNGTSNTAIGVDALISNTGGSNNTAIGVSTLALNSTGNNNTSSGANAMNSNTTGTGNTVAGFNALFHNTSGNNNTAMGPNALLNSFSGSNNIAIGNSAGLNLGVGQTAGDNNIDIGNAAVTGESGIIRVGTSPTHTAAFIAGIRGATTINNDAVAVMIDSAGQLGTVSSSRRVKDDIADMGEASGALMKLRPVTFHYKSDKNPKGRTLQYGLVAEEVAGVAPGLVAHSSDGKVETVYYQFLAPMLVNEYQKQQRTIQAQAVRIAELERDRRAQTARIETLERQTAEIAELKRQSARFSAMLRRLERQEQAAAR